MDSYRTDTDIHNVYLNMYTNISTRKYVYRYEVKKKPQNQSKLMFEISWKSHLECLTTFVYFHSALRNLKMEQLKYELRKNIIFSIIFFVTNQLMQQIEDLQIYTHLLWCSWCTSFEHYTVAVTFIRIRIFDKTLCLYSWHVYTEIIVTRLFRFPFLSGWRRFPKSILSVVNLWIPNNNN